MKTRLGYTVTNDHETLYLVWLESLRRVMAIMMKRGRSLVTSLLQIFLLGALAAACAATPMSESTGGYIDDAAITAKVKTALAQDPKIGISAAQIHIITYKGVVELSGFVDSDAEVAEAGSVADQVAGVKSVQNNLIVKTQAAP